MTKASAARTTDGPAPRRKHDVVEAAAALPAAVRIAGAGRKRKSGVPVARDAPAARAVARGAARAARAARVPRVPRVGKAEANLMMNLSEEAEEDWEVAVEVATRVLRAARAARAAKAARVPRVPRVPRVEKVEVNLMMNLLEEAANR